MKIDLGWTTCNIDTKKVGRRRALYTCICGNEWEAPYYQRNGLDYTPKCSSCTGKKHNKYYTKIYKQYHGMIQRCTNSNAFGYKDYGERGISICNEWIHSFDAYYEWAIENGYKEGLTIERKDNNGNYEAENCRFIPQSEQYFNTRIRKDNSSGFRGISFDSSRNKFMAAVTVDGKTKQLGRYNTAKEAAIKRNHYIQKHGLILQLNKVGI